MTCSHCGLEIKEKNAGVSLKNVDLKDYSVLDLDEYSKLYTIKTTTTPTLPIQKNPPTPPL